MRQWNVCNAKTAIVRIPRPWYTGATSTLSAPISRVFATAKRSAPGGTPTGFADRGSIDGVITSHRPVFGGRVRARAGPAALTPGEGAEHGRAAWTWPQSLPRPDRARRVLAAAPPH